MVPNVGRRWREEWEPTLPPVLEKARRTDYKSLSDQQLWDKFEEMVDHLLYGWTIHGRINFQLVGASWFVDFYNENFEPENQTEGYEVLQGFHTKSVDAGRSLWRLSRSVKNNPRLTQMFRDNDPKRLVDELEKHDDGKAFLTALGAYLEEFGWRADTAYEICEPMWVEDPSIPLGALQGYVELGDDASPELLFNRAVQRREELLAKARGRLKNDPEKLARFNWLYEAGKDNLPVAEDHNFYIDQQSVVILRLPVLEIGRRLVDKGAIDKVDDVFMLLKDELKDALFNGADKRATVKQRFEHWDAAGKILPPPVLGTPEAAAEDPFAEALLGKMLGIGRTPEPDRDPDVIRGIAGSPGTVQGVAKVVRSLNEASKLQQGDIMVCEMTLPPWTPLFSTVSGLVADTGGIFSHCAIVAREYRLPAVVGTLVGTRTIQDGMTITVDGTKGIVRIDKRV